MMRPSTAKRTEKSKKELSSTAKDDDPMMVSGKELGTPHTSSYGYLPKSKRNMTIDDNDNAGKKKQSSDFAKNKGPIFG